MIKSFSLRSYRGKFTYLIGILLSLIIPSLIIIFSSALNVAPSQFGDKRVIWWFYSLSILVHEGKFPWGVLSVLNLYGLVILFRPVLKNGGQSFSIGCFIGTIIIIFVSLPIIGPIITFTSLVCPGIVVNTQDWKETNHNYHVVHSRHTCHDSLSYIFSTYQLFDCDPWEIRCEQIMAYRSTDLIKETPDFKSLVHALNGTRSTVPYAGIPLSAVLKIQGHTQYSSFISYTDQNGRTLEMQSTTTPVMPINVVSPFIANFNLPRTAPLDFLELDINLVGQQDELPIKEFNYRWWTLSSSWDRHRYWSSRDLPPEAIQNVRLDLPPGLYVIRAAYTWGDNKYGGNTYGFLVDVK